MFYVEGTKIYLTRGDTFYATVTMRRENQEYTPQAGDSLRFVLKRADMVSNQSAYKDTRPLIDIPIPTETCVLKIDSEETKPLKFGNYVYDIELTYANGDVDTFINNAEFELIPEVG